MSKLDTVLADPDLAGLFWRGLEQAVRNLAERRVRTSLFLEMTSAAFLLVNFRSCILGFKTSKPAPVSKTSTLSSHFGFV